MSVEAVLVRKSTKEIIKHGLYPREPITPFLEGEIDPDYEWLIKHIPYPEPVYDSRIYVMGTNLPDLQFLNDFQEHPQYAGVREYRITYSPVKRTNVEIFTSIENAEKEANNLIWSEQLHKDKMLFMLSSSDKASAGLQLNAEEQESIDEMRIITAKLQKNKDNKNILVAQVEAGQEPNIDSGWESV